MEEAIKNFEKQIFDFAITKPDDSKINSDAAVSFERCALAFTIRDCRREVIEMAS